MSLCVPFKKLLKWKKILIQLPEEKAEHTALRDGPYLLPW
jgi:hypothetical protein